MFARIQVVCEYVMKDVQSCCFQCRDKKFLVILNYLGQ